MWTIPQLWKGETCFILGGGSSLYDQFHIPETLIKKVRAGDLPASAFSDYMEVLVDKPVIGTNMAMRLGWWFNVLLFGDEGFWKLNKWEILQWPGLKVASWKGQVPGDRRIKFPRRDSMQTGLSTHQDSLCWNFNTGAMAIDLAVHFGVQKIYLLGFDMYVNQGMQHWHRYYRAGQPPPKHIAQTFHRHLQGFPVIAKQATERGIEIINLNPLSKIECFPKTTLDEVINHKH